jgi:hypothetical protein
MARSRTSGQGRPKGVPNKLNASLREMILGALSDAGGQEYLARCAAETPGPFLALLGKILPTQVTGEEGGPVTYTIITGVPRDGEEEGDY